MVDLIHLEPEKASGQEKQKSPASQSPSDEHCSKSYTFKPQKHKAFTLSFSCHKHSFIMKKGRQVQTLHCPLEQAVATLKTAALAMIIKSKFCRVFIFVKEEKKKQGNNVSVCWVLVSSLGFSVSAEKTKNSAELLTRN